MAGRLLELDGLTIDRCPSWVGPAGAWSSTMMANELVGWVFVGYPDEHLRSILRAGTVHLWDDARTMGKVPGQPVLFLQTQEQGAAWIGSGVVHGVEERWKAFGVYVETRTILARMVPAFPASPEDSPGHHRPVSMESIRFQGAAAWENRTLAARVGLVAYRSRTPYLEEGRDVRLTGSDWRILCELQPSLRTLWPG